MVDCEISNRSARLNPDEAVLALGRILLLAEEFVDDNACTLLLSSSYMREVIAGPRKL